MIYWKSARKLSWSDHKLPKFWAKKLKGQRFVKLRNLKFHTCFTQAVNLKFSPGITYVTFTLSCAWLNTVGLVVNKTLQMKLRKSQNPKFQFSSYRREVNFILKCCISFCYNNVS